MIEDPVFPIVPRRHPGRWVLGMALAAVFAILAWKLARNEIFDYATVPKYLFDPRVLEGVLVTLYVTCGSMLIGLVLGVGLAVMRLSDNGLMVSVANLFIWFFRGTPVLVQLIFWFNIGIIFPTIGLSLPGGTTLLDISTNTIMTASVTALLGLGLNEGAYMAEIVRAGILSIDPGQREAAEALGLPPGKILRRIVLPQALRVIVPPAGNQFVSLLKTSSLVSVIAAGDLLTQATRIYNENFRILELLVVASLWYLLLTTIANVGQHFLERRFARGFAGGGRPTIIRAFRDALSTGRTSPHPQEPA